MYRVIKIIDNEQIVINAGKHSIKEGTKVRVIVPGKEDVIDPETNKSLGKLDFVKANLIVKTVYDNMSICTNEPRSGVSLSSMISYTPSLDVDLTEISGGYDEHDRTIRIGDLVEKL